MVEIIRPTKYRGVFLQTWDVYISKACVFAGTHFLQSPYAVPAGCTNYRAFLKQQCVAVPGFHAGLASLHGKRLACWCVSKARPHCHGIILGEEAAAAAAATELKRRTATQAGKRACKRVRA
jgi:hypothetical protein